MSSRKGMRRLLSSQERNTIVESPYLRPNKTNPFPFPPLVESTPRNDQNLSATRVHRKQQVRAITDSSDDDVFEASTQEVTVNVTEEKQAEADTVRKSSPKKRRVTSASTSNQRKNDNDTTYSHYRVNEAEITEARARKLVQFQLKRWKRKVQKLQELVANL